MNRLIWRAILWPLTALFVFGTLVGLDDLGFRQTLFSGALSETVRAKALYKLLYDASVGGLVSLFFYALLVVIPERARRRRVRRGLEREYRHFKTTCIYEMLGVVHGSIDVAIADKLLDQKKFGTHFRANVGNGQDRFDAFLNGFGADNLRTILSAIDQFRDEVSFALSVVDIDDDEAFAFLRRISAVAHDIKDTELGYDEVMPLSRFLWFVLSGFDMVTGQTRVRTHNQ